MLTSVCVVCSAWGTILEQNGSNENGGKDCRMTLAELSKITSDPLSLLSAVRLLYIRLRIWGGTRSKFRFRMFPVTAHSVY
jgi:hypothetical protein